MRAVSVAVALCAATAPLYPLSALAASFTPNISAILNGGFTQRSHEFEGIGSLPVNGEHAAGPGKGFWLDHTELSMSANADDMFYGKLSLVLDTDENETELELEEAFVQTLAMPAGLSVRGGRFAPVIGYLNDKHPHADFFVDRPLAYRAFFGKHYYDDGVRLNWVAPTELFVELGAEAFAGRHYPASSGKSVGSRNLYAKIGGDLNASNSWQAGLSWLNTDNDPEHCSAHEHGDEEEVHEHGAYELCNFDGERNYWVGDLTWKWAPGGNFKYQALTLNAEYFYVRDKGEYLHEEEGDDHDHDHEEDAFIDGASQGWYLSAAYQFSPRWTVGARYSRVKQNAFYDNDFKPQATDLMLQWNYSHFSRIRLQYSYDQSVEGVKDNIVSVQYTMSIGDHGAHLF